MDTGSSLAPWIQSLFSMNDMYTYVELEISRSLKTFSVQSELWIYDIFYGTIDFITVMRHEHFKLITSSLEFYPTYGQYVAVHDKI